MLMAYLEVGEYRVFAIENHARLDRVVTARGLVGFPYKVNPIACSGTTSFLPIHDDKFKPDFSTSQGSLYQRIDCKFEVGNAVAKGLSDRLGREPIVIAIIVIVDLNGSSSSGGDFFCCVERHGALMCPCLDVWYVCASI